MLPAIAALLEAKTGLDARSIGTAAIERAVRERMAAAEYPHPEAYWTHLSASADEQQRLIEAVVVSETWFFRNREAFTALSGIVTGEWLAAHPTRQLRVLSAACATGEEPYSIAMALLDCGLAPERIRIDAVDISTRAIAHALDGVYGRNSFRGADLTFRERHFERTARGYHLSSRVRELVQLRSANLFGADAFAGVEDYDVIFCRNVLIYFDRPTQRRAIEILGGLMAADGVMFVGPAEAALLTESGRISARLPHAFAFRRGREATRKIQPLALPTIGAPAWLRDDPRARQQRAPAQRAPQPVPAAQGALESTPAPSDHVTAEMPWMALAARLADQGQLAHALQVCEAGLRDSPPSAPALYLLGLLHDAAGRPEQAGEYYRKALYLDPTHEEALVHLATLLTATGDAAGAARLVERARRVRPAGGS